MKANYMKEFALPTIEKAQEMAQKADAANLYLSVDINITTEVVIVSVYELDDEGRIKTPAAFHRASYSLNKVSDFRKFKEYLEEADAFINEYAPKTSENLEKEVAELTARLSSAKSQLSKMRRAAK